MFLDLPPPIPMMRGTAPYIGENVGNKYYLLPHKVTVGYVIFG
jgi:hypothetical protein